MDSKQQTRDWSSYCRDESRMTGCADRALFPQNTEEMAQAFAAAERENLSVTLQGARTGIVGGAVPQGGLVISTERMHGLLALRRAQDGSYCLRVQAGCTLEQVRTFLGRPLPPGDWREDAKTLCAAMQKTPQIFPPNPTESTATMGGLFATNAMGSNSLRYGSVGQYVQGLSWVTPGGQRWEIHRGQYIFDESGCVLPDGSRLDCPTDLNPQGLALLAPVPGLDLIDFLAGSEGWVGAAAELELRLFPAPRQNWAVLYFFAKQGQSASFLDLLAQWREIRGNADLLSAVEFYDTDTLHLLRQCKDGLSTLKSLPELPENAQEAVYVVLQGEDSDGLEEALGAHLDAFAEVGGGEDDTWAAMGEAEMAPFEALRHVIPELMNMRIDALRLTFPAFCKTATDFAGPPNLWAKYASMYRQGIADAGLTGYVFGHILENRLHVNLLAGSEHEREICRDTMRTWAKQVIADGGLVAGESGLGKLRIPLYGDLIPTERWVQLKRIRRFLDPQGRMAVMDWEERP